MAARKERDARRRRLLVEQQESAEAAEKRAQMDAMVASLSKQSAAEQALAQRLWQVGGRAIGDCCGSKEATSVVVVSPQLSADRLHPCDWLALHVCMPLPSLCLALKL